MKNFILSILAVLITIFIIKNTNKVNIIESCNLFIHKVFPSLFTMLFISNILINLNLIKYINIPFKYINKKVFRINSNTSYILLISILTGSGGNAKVIENLYNNKFIIKNDIQKILLFSHFINPFFIINNIKYKTLLVLFSHYLSNIIIGIIFRNKYLSDDEPNIKSNNKSLINILFDSIENTIHISLFILGTIITFNIISTSINSKVLSSILEFSSGINYIKTLDISIKLKTILYGSILSFGGICRHMQIYGILSKINIKYIPYLIARIIHSVLTALIIYILY